MTRAGTLLVLIGFFAVPLHLAVEEHHEWRHESGEHERHDHESPDDSHPAVDHELSALAKAPRFVPPVVDVLILRLEILPPDTQGWEPRIEPDAQSPPDVLASPPRSPRSSPV